MMSAEVPEPSADGPAIEAVRAAHRDPAASMLLLRSIEDLALDPSYREVAASRGKRISRLRQVALFTAIVAFAFVTTVAAVNMRQWWADDTSPRALLAAQAREVQERLDDLEAENASLASQARATEVLEGVSTESGSSDFLVAASTRVSGPGVVVSIVEEASLSGHSVQFRDVDLRAVQNILWSAGAEAMAINGNRVGPSTSVRFAGSSVLVNLVPVSSPYIIEAIGDPRQLIEALRSGDGARRIRDLERSTGASVSETRAEKLILSSLPLRASAAEPIEEQ